MTAKQVEELEVSQLDADTIAALREASYLTLKVAPATEQARRLAQTALEGVLAWEASHAPRKNQRRSRLLQAFSTAVAAIVSEVALSVDRGEGRMVHRSKHAVSFSRQPVTYRNFAAVMAALEGMGWLNRTPGFFERLPGMGGAGRGWSTRWRATATMVAHVRECGIAEGHASKHFAVPAPTDLIILRSRKKRVGGGETPAEIMRFTETDRTMALKAAVAELNEFATQDRISGAQHQGFCRVFNGGDCAAFEWDLGGRLTSIGSPNYQNIPARDRLGLLFDGKPVAEIDIAGCHLTLIYGLQGAAFDPRRDPYQIPGIPRSVVKAWLVTALGQNKFPSRWPPEQVKQLNKAPKSVARRFSVRRVKTALLAHHAPLRHWPNSNEGFFRLMFHESEIILATMLRLKREHDVMSLPIYDSIMVPHDKRELAASVLTEEFQRHAGVVPRLKIIPAGET